jgi:carbon monoxide dehydrogenase subunit G
MQARGRVPGSAVDITSVMRLTPTEDGGTLLDWEADVVVSGTIASVGARLLQGVADRQVQQVFACVRARLAELPAGSGSGAAEPS